LRSFRIRARSWSFSGYGGSYTTAAGEAAAAFALTGGAPPWLDEEVFAPTRLVAR
jgi:hypothetical protein